MRSFLKCSVGGLLRDGSSVVQVLWNVTPAHTTILQPERMIDASGNAHML